MDESPSGYIIEETDRKLYLLNNQLSKAEYHQDRHPADEQAGQRVEEINGKINALLTLTNPGIMEGVKKNSIKAGLLEKEIRFARIETDPSAREARRNLRNRLNQIDTSDQYAVLMKGTDRQERRRAMTRIGEAVGRAESSAREMFHALNRVARNAGFDGYLHAKLDYEGLTLERLYTLFEQWRDQHPPLKRRIAAGQGEQWGHQIEPWDVLYLLQQRYSRTRNAFDADKKSAILDRLMTELGQPSAHLPITIEHHPLSFSGACYRFEPGKEIRIVLNSDLEGFNAYFYMLHEFGHAVYYCFCPSGSELLIDNHLSREIMADFWTRFLTNNQFLTRIMDFSERQSREIIQARTEYEALRILIYMRDAMFTVEALQSPDRPFKEMWREVNRKWLDMEDSTGAVETFDMYHPLDMKSYVFAQVLSDRAFQRLSVRAGDPLNPRFLELVIKELYEPGNSVDWREKFQVENK